MLLNKKKCNAMIFNFCRDYQFTSKILIENEEMEIVSQTKLLGVIVNNNLTWDDNTKYLVQRANSRLRLLHKLSSFSVPTEDLINIYILYIRSILEQSCQVWHSSLTLENWRERAAFQRSAFGRSTAGNDVVATIFICVFFPVPPSRPFLIKGVRGSKNLLSKSCFEHVFYTQPT